MEKPKITTEGGAPKPERESRIDKLMETRHKNAVVAAELEEMLVQGIESNEDNEKLTEKIDKKYNELDIRYNAEERHIQYKVAISKYLDQAIFAKNTEELVCEKIEKQGKDMTSENLGQYIFGKYKDGQSRGKIFAERREGYFIVFFEDNKDYSNFYNTAFKSKEAEMTVGCFYGSFDLGDLGSAKVILIRGASGDRTENVVAHERQHFLNGTAFKGFELTEPEITVPEEFPALREDDNEIRDMGFRQVKNELIARLREDSSVEHATGFLKHKLYDNLLDNFTAKGEKEVFVIMEQIKNKIGEFLLYNDSLKARAVLVYQLIDIPLVRMPAYLDEIVRIFERNKEELLNLMPNISFKDIRNIKHHIRLEREEGILEDKITDVIDLSVEYGMYDRRTKDLIKDIKEGIKKFTALYEEYSKEESNK